jgi:hypothetical protein
VDLVLRTVYLTKLEHFHIKSRCFFLYIIGHPNKILYKYTSPRRLTARINCGLFVANNQLCHYLLAKMISIENYGIFIKNLYIFDKHHFWDIVYTNTKCSNEKPLNNALVCSTMEHFCPILRGYYDFPKFDNQNIPSWHTLIIIMYTQRQKAEMNENCCSAMVPNNFGYFSRGDGGV